MTDLVLAIRFPVVGGAHGQDDDHDEQSPAGGQDGYQGFIVRGLLWKQETGRLVLLWALRWFDSRRPLSLTLVSSS